MNEEACRRERDTNREGVVKRSVVDVEGSSKAVDLKKGKERERGGREEE